MSKETAQSSNSSTATNHNSTTTSSQSCSPSPSSSSSSNKIKLICSNSETIEIELYLARMSPFLEAKLTESANTLREIRIDEPRVAVRELDLIFNQWCEKYKDEDIQEEDYEEQRLQLNVARAERYVAHSDANFRNRVSHHRRRQLTHIPEWDRRWLARLDNSTVYSVINAAYYLQIRRLVNICCQAVANRLKMMNKDELKHEFGIPKVDAEAVTTIVSVQQQPTDPVNSNPTVQDDDDGIQLEGIDQSRRG